MAALAVAAGLVSALPIPAPAPNVQVNESYGKLPLFFIPNEGQIDETVKFYEKGSGHATFFTPDGIYLRLVRRPRPDVSAQAVSDPIAKDRLEPKSALLRLIPLGATKHPQIVAEGMQQGKVNYFSGQDPRQ